MYANTTNHPSVRWKLLYLCTCQYPGMRTGLRVFRRSLSRSGMPVIITRLHALMAKVHTQDTQQWRTLPLSITSYSNRTQATTISISQPQNNGSEEAAALLSKALRASTLLEPVGVTRITVYVIIYLGSRVQVDTGRRFLDSFGPITYFGAM